MRNINQSGKAKGKVNEATYTPGAKHGVDTGVLATVSKDKLAPGSTKYTKKGKE